MTDVIATTRSVLCEGRCAASGPDLRCSTLVDAIVRERVKDYWEQLALEQIEDEFGVGGL